MTDSKMGKRKNIIAVLVIVFLLFLTAYGSFNGPLDNKQPPKEELTAWWIEAVITGLVSALTVILAFALSMWAKKKDKERNKEEFLQALHIDLKRVLARLISNSNSLKAKLGILNSDDLKWMISSFLKHELNQAGDPLGQLISMPENSNEALTDEKLDILAREFNKQMIQKDNEFARLSEISIGFLECNLHLISLLAVADQQLLFSIIGRIETINTWILKLEGQYEKSFDCGSNQELVARITKNKKHIYSEIANAENITANEIMEFL